MNLTITDKSGKKCSAFPSFFCVKTIQSMYPGGVGGQVEWFNDLVFTVVRVAVSVVGSGEVISVLRVEEYQVISFSLNLILCLYLQSLYLHDCRP